ncbi:hypothetical protein [Trichothermofontia sp.]
MTLLLLKNGKKEKHGIATIAAGGQASLGPFHAVMALVGNDKVVVTTNVVKLDVHGTCPGGALT